MKKTLVPFLTFAVMFTSILVGCTVHNTSIADFVGTWTATSWTETELASPYQVVDVIAAGGSWQIIIASDGSYTGTVNPGSGSIAVSGTATIIDNSTMTVQQGAQTFHITYTLSGNTWTLTHSDGTAAFSNGNQPSKQDIKAVRS
jgi:hypothetical protein